MVAVRFPEYIDSFNVPGYHFHFCKDDIDAVEKTENSKKQGMLLCKTDYSIGGA